MMRASRMLREAGIRQSAWWQEAARAAGPSSAEVLAEIQRPLIARAEAMAWTTQNVGDALWRALDLMPKVSDFTTTESGETL